MIDRLPNELLREILSPPLQVADQRFADNGLVSPFNAVRLSASRMLLVCKRWMRIGTSLLYETVIIRSEAQAQALAFALSKNPQFGEYIKKIRVEGAYVYLSDIAKLAPKVTDLCFTLALRTKDNVTGLIALLDSVNPNRVIITLHEEVNNKKHAAVLDVLCDRVVEWTNMVSYSLLVVRPTVDII